MTNACTCRINSNNETNEVFQLVPELILTVSLVIVVIGEMFVFVLSTGWFFKIILQSIRKRKTVQFIGQSEHDQIEAEKNQDIVHRRNLILIAALLVESLHLFGKGIGFVMFSLNCIMKKNLNSLSIVTV